MVWAKAFAVFLDNERLADRVAHCGKLTGSESVKANAVFRHEKRQINSLCLTRSKKRCIINVYKILTSPIEKYI